VLRFTCRKATRLRRPRDQHGSCLFSDAAQTKTAPIGVRQVPGPLLGIVTEARALQHPEADVRAHHLPGAIPEAIRQHHRDAVGLLAGGAGGAPDPEGLRVTPDLERGPPEQVEVRRLAEEIGLVGGQEVDRRLDLRGLRAAGEEPKVLAEAIEVALLDASAESARDQQPLG
jgi:hypothetical protein